MPFSRRSFFKAAGLTLAGAACAASYPLYIEPHNFEIRRSRIASKWFSGKTAIRILHLSDLHASNAVSYETLAEAFRLGLAEKPHLICLTGDYVTKQLTKTLDGYREVLAVLPKAAPTFATLGNHDGGSWASTIGGYPSSTTLIDLLESAGISVLHNQNREITVNGQRLSLIGLGDLWSRELDFAAAFRGLPKVSDRPRIVLSHNPDTKDILIWSDWDLLLSGHTHGGQVNIPGFGPPVLPVTDKRFFDGLYEWKNRHLYVSRGVGGIYGAVRFNCRPEVGILDLVAA